MEEGINKFVNNYKISSYMNKTFSNDLIENNYYTTYQIIRKTFQNKKGYVLIILIL